MSIDDFYTEFMQDIYARSGAEQNFTEAVFTERICDFLVDQATIENYVYSGYKNSPRGIRVDAWDYNNDTEVLSLFVTDFRFSGELETLQNTEVIRNFRRLEKFFSESLNIKFLIALEESAPGYELAREIYDKNKSKSISRVQFFLLTNIQLSNRVSAISKNDIDGYSCTYDIWDISRLFRIESSGRAREDVVIDFQKILPEGIPCLPAFTGSDNFASYLLVMPGEIIADLYDKYGERLLEQNVRTFLQFRGKVNKGIRNTIKNEPEMFFAYNNGLTATAENVQTDILHGRIQSVTNFQIVNGGQTTASIFTATKKNKAELSKVYIQVKLTVISPEQAETVVPRISEYANTQNKVSAADFFSNHPFHLRMEEISRRLWAPSPQGGLRETHWFYERARGQYANAQANLTQAQTKEFLSKNPRSQMFTKTDLAKFEYSLNMQPHIVSLGAQKNFAKFANEIGQNWEKNEKQFNELYFQNIIAKAILFHFLDKSIMKQSWYGGYKANIVTYSLAKLARMVSETGKNLDLTQIWKSQKLSIALETQLMAIAELVNEHIQNTPEGITNVTEWCKKELCWKKLQELSIPLNHDLVAGLLDNDVINSQEKSAEKVQKTDDGIFAQKYVIEKGAEYWKQVARYGMEGAFLSPKEMSIIGIACEIPNKIPSEKQSEIVVKIEEKLKNEGFFV
ncbi:AIPR family protein [Desulfobacterium sp. N47]|uniref:AIPR family protein n=1 Tax=Desulfobacterium sp. N47 TaxID=3115210 RepID=UPI003C82170C